MKKYLVLIGAAILVMALVSPAMAQFKSYGHMEIQTIWKYREDFNNGSGSSDSSMWDRNQTRHKVFERFRYHLEYGDAKTVRAVIGFEANGMWGDNEDQFAKLQNDAGKMAIWMTDSVALGIRVAYIDFVVPNTPIGVSAGLLYHGIGDHLFLSGDGPGVQVRADFAPHKIMGLWWRENDEDQFKYNVNDGYALQYEISQQMWNFYTYGAYKNDLRGTLTWKDHPWYLAAGGGVRPGNWDLSAQFIYNGGKREYTNGASDDTYQAWVGELYVKYNIGPGMRAVVDGFYATGTNANNSNDINMYNFPVTNQLHTSESTAWIYNRRGVFYFMNTDLGYINQRQWSFAGHWLAHAGFEYSPTKWLETIWSYCYIGDSSSGSVGTHVDKGTGLVVANQVNTVGRTDKDESYVGSELSLLATLKIYANFTYTAGFGYFFPGAVFDAPGRGADQGWALASKLLYAF